MDAEIDRWSRGEAWIAKKLATTGMRWMRRVPCWFCQYPLGLRIQLVVPGTETAADAACERALSDQAVLVIRVQEFDEEQASAALRAAIELLEPRNSRRRALGLKAIDGPSRSRTCSPGQSGRLPLQADRPGVAGGRADRAHASGGLTAGPNELTPLRRLSIRQCVSRVTSDSNDAGRAPGKHLQNQSTRCNAATR